MMRGPKELNMFRSEVTIAETLAKAGYRTGLFGKWHLGAHRDHGPTEQGFDEFFGIRDGFIDNYVHYQLHAAGYHDLYEGTEEVFHRGDYFPDLITDRALSFNAQRGPVVSSLNRTLLLVKILPEIGPSTLSGLLHRG
jgi:arylsulfatase A-like enzyme